MQYRSVGALWLCALVGGCTYDPSGVDQMKNPDASEGLVDAAVVDAAVVDAPIDAPDLPDAEPPDASPPDARPPDATPPDAEVQLPCPVGYSRGQGTNSNHCYRFVNTARSFLSAEADCENASGGGIKAHLVTVDKEAEYSSILSALPGLQLWIGASDRTTEDTFLNVTGGPLTTDSHFLPGEPNNSNNGEDCVLFLTELVNGYNDSNCSQQHPYLCEFDAVPPDPAAF